MRVKKRAANRGTALILAGIRTLLALAACLQGISAFQPDEFASAARDRGYALGAQDAVTIRVGELDEFSTQNPPLFRIDPQGNIRIPIAGRIHAEGLTAEQLEVEIAQRLSKVMREPDVSVAIAEMRSHPVSVLGSVKSPGVLQVTGRKTLFEVLSLGGGLSPDAGNKIHVTRRSEAGPLPLAGSMRDPSGNFTVGHLDVRAVMEAKNPGDNIEVRADDVITVPKAELVYVIGAVKKSGGFVLNEKEQISILQALSLAEGLDRAAAAKRACILRQDSPGGQRSQIPVDVQRILEGRAEDLALRANDILFIPTSASKTAGIRALEAAIQLGTGIAIYRR